MCCGMTRICYLVLSYSSGYTLHSLFFISARLSQTAVDMVFDSSFRAWFHQRVIKYVFISFAPFRCSTILLSTIPPTQISFRKSLNCTINSFLCVSFSHSYLPWSHTPQLYDMAMKSVLGDQGNSAIEIVGKLAVEGISFTVLLKQFWVKSHITVGFSAFLSSIVTSKNKIIPWALFE